MCWADLKVERAVLCVTENVAQAMGLTDRGKLDIGRRGDFVVLSNDGRVKETWILGAKVHES
jgi:N-acetylglucosamine-6-phosphate deacetylase